MITIGNQLTQWTIINYCKRILSKLDWPIQQRPDRSTFKYWKKCINLAFDLRGKQQLPIPMGDCIVGPADSANEWEFYLQPYSDWLIRNTFDEAEYEVHLLHQNTHHYSGMLKYDTVPDAAESALPTMVFSVTPSLVHRAF